MSVRVRAPSRGLVTRWPTESADGPPSSGAQYAAPAPQRASVVASNVRYEDGVVCNAPGYDRVNLTASILVGLVASWRLDEASGVRMDATLSHNDLDSFPGSESGVELDVVQSTGKFGSAAFFPGLSVLHLCNVLGITNGGGDTFDCYSLGVDVQTLPSAGSHFFGGWMLSDDDFRTQFGDNFDLYTVGPVVTLPNNGTGFSGLWASSG